ncbi:helix-turn-helix domain-containing protein [Mucilaginibacter celer]|uniref:Helix-turn-helix domain-containing protein n=1 Tax=Mucilaginibacter celer TaxID=2305508 RepID=A0A494W0H8_9SPHI|nr:helix-turn-helix transcriptional regulator [Mucilaginibacter celer]AYL96772.1 helix-turn-helix domain-containing protein [Mucilaginibacter celer]
MNVEIVNSRVQAILSDIRTRRIQKGYSQGQCGAMLHISQNSFSKIELGSMELTLERLMLIAKMLEVDFFELLAAPVKSPLCLIEGELMQAS